MSFPPTRVILMSPLITRRCNHSVGVAMCLMRPAPLRIAMARPAFTPSMISRLGLSTPQPNPFPLTSTPCCCKTTPGSRNIETQPIPAAAALTAVYNSVPALERLTTACVVDVVSEDVSDQKSCGNSCYSCSADIPAKFESLWHVICLGTISCLSKLWINRKRTHLLSASTSAVVGSAMVGKLQFSSIG